MIKIEYIYNKNSSTSNSKSLKMRKDVIIDRVTIERKKEVFNAHTTHPASSDATNATNILFVRFFLFEGAKNPSETSEKKIDHLLLGVVVVSSISCCCFNRLKRMVAHRRHHFLLETFCFCAIIISLFPEKAYAIAGKCSACKAVSAELQEALNKENKQRNHIDMRGRLDSKGQRYGKLIPYSVSEQRYLELVEDFCETSRVPDYQLSKADASRNETEDSWYKAPKGTVRGAQAKTEQREIQTYCERVMEEVEEELQTLLYEEKLNETNVEQYVCYELSPQCVSKAEWKKMKKDRKEGMDRHTGKYDTATMKEL